MPLSGAAWRSSDQASRQLDRYPDNVIAPGSVSLSAFKARRNSQAMATPLPRVATLSTVADKLNRGASPWLPVAALQRLERE